MQRPLIKVCGMRETANIREVEALGLDFMGFIFYPKSPRYMGMKPMVYLPETVKRVGVFVNETEAEILRLAAAMKLDFIQLHGGESPAYCARLKRAGLRIIKAFSVASATDLETTRNYEPYCDYFVFDTKTPAYGGSGKTFDWHILESYRGEVPFLLSGGIGPESVDALHNFEHPKLAGYDLNSRFEREAGVKDVKVLADFLDRLKTTKHG